MPSCAEGGVLGVLPGLLGVVQAVETIKLLLGAGESLVGRLLLFDALTMRFREVRLRKDPDCAVCGPRPTITKLADVGEACEPSRPGASAVVSSRSMSSVPEVSVEELKAMRDRGDPFVLVDVRQPHEHAISDLSGSVKIPLATLPAGYTRLSPDDDIVVYCRVGGRSAQAVAFLLERGYAKARNLVGGINLWAERIDPSLPRY